MNGFELFSPNVLLAFHHCGVSLPSPQMHCDRERFRSRLATTHPPKAE
jgi:hypothetical protein